MDENEKYRESLRRENPHSFEIIHDIKEDKSIKLKRLQILNMPLDKEEKEKLWKTYLKHEYDRGIITTNEYFKLNEWRLHG